MSIDQKSGGLEVQWQTGALPSEEGWYIVTKRGVSSPSLLQFKEKSHSSWDRVVSWFGPFTFPEGVPSSHSFGDGFDHDAFIRSHELPESTTTDVSGIAKELDETPQAAREAYRLFDDFIRIENKLKGIPESAMVAWDRLRDSLGLHK